MSMANREQPAPTLQELDAALASRVDALWRRGWQPADLLRFATRRLLPAQQRLLRAVVAAQIAGYAPATVDAGWFDQLAEAKVEIWWDRKQCAVQACAADDPEGGIAFLGRSLEVLHLLALLPALQVLGPLPGTATAAAAQRRSPVDERVLARVRALLAKAESTTFPAEAETFTAGAQALMARHSIDHALLAASGHSPQEGPAGRRIGIDNPYEAPKVVLLGALASANRCRAIWTKDLGFVTVIGFPNDLDTVEVLFTSLLVQAISTMTREGSRADWAGRSRTRSFRQSFLLSYATRIRERLTETTRQQTAAAAAEHVGSNLLPILASRQVAVEEATAVMFPRLTSASMGAARDGEGWASGRAAADLATLQASTGAIA